MKTGTFTEDADGAQWVVYYQNFSWCVLVQPGHTSARFKIVNVLCEDDDDGEAEYEADPGEEAFTSEFVTNPAIANVEVSGFVKSDGCSHLQTNTGCMTHICGMRDAEAFMQAVRAAFYGCIEHCERFDSVIGESMLLAPLANQRD